jgi:hypothetical protein
MVIAMVFPFLLPEVIDAWWSKAIRNVRVTQPFGAALLLCYLNVLNLLEDQIAEAVVAAFLERSRVAMKFLQLLLCVLDGEVGVAPRYVNFVTCSDDVHLLEQHHAVRNDVLAVGYVFSVRAGGRGGFHLQYLRGHNVFMFLSLVG